jgi:hypothetical protein
MKRATKTAYRHRRSSDGAVVWIVPVDVLTAFALDHAAPTWEQLEAYVASARGSRDERLEVAADTMTERLEWLRLTAGWEARAAAANRKRLAS